MRRITVIMSVYNCADTLREALDSLCSQSYTQWICVLCDDGSKDNSYEIAKEYSDKYEGKFILVKNKKNMGLNYSLNKCLELVKTEYVARMDGDDISLPQRFEKQIEFLDKNKEYDIVSSGMIQFDEEGDFRVGKVVEKPTKEQVAVGSYICHAPSMMRTFAIKSISGYTVDKKILRVEDVDLWIRMYANGSRCYNFEEPLYKMRDDRNAISRRKYRYRINSTRVRLKGCRLLGLGIKYKIQCFKPMIIGLIPMPIYKRLHKNK